MIASSTSSAGDVFSIAMREVAAPNKAGHAILNTLVGFSGYPMWLKGSKAVS